MAGATKNSVIGKVVACAALIKTEIWVSVEPLYSVVAQVIVEKTK